MGQSVGSLRHPRAMDDLMLAQSGLQNSRPDVLLVNANDGGQPLLGSGTGIKSVLADQLHSGASVLGGTLAAPVGPGQYAIHTGTSLGQAPVGTLHAPYPPPQTTQFFPIHTEPSVPGKSVPGKLGPSWMYLNNA